MKSKFNKPNTVYPHGSLREQPEMEKPSESHYNFFKDADKIANFEQVRFNNDMRAYEKHIASLRIIPCSENNWKDGQQLTQNIDYVVISHDPDSGKFLALPMETDDELWKELKEEIDEGATWFEIKQQFTIKRKTS